MNEVGNQFQAQLHALTAIRHQEGEIDGKRWATEFATQEQLSLLEEFSTCFDNRNFFVDPGPSDSSWTPAHELVAFLYTDYPTDEDGLQPDDCEVFRQFWQPFVQEPLDELIPTFGHIAFRGRHKLQDGHYVIGFIAGALGISDKLRQQLSDTERAHHPTEI